MSKKYRIGFIPLIIALLLPFILRLAYINVPLERDEGAYAYGAWRILQGDVLYKDMVDFTPPGVFYLYAAGISIFGKQIGDIHLFTCFYMEIVLIWMLLLARKLSNDRSAWISTAILGCIAAEPAVLGFTANKEIFMLLPIIASSHLLLKGLEEDKSLFICMSGVMIGFGFLIKQVLVFLGLGLMAYLLLYLYRRNNLKKFWVYAGLYSTGSAAVLFGAGLYYLLRNALGDFYFWVFKYPFQFADASLDKILMLKHLGRILLHISAGDALFWFFGLFAVYVLLRKKQMHGWFLVCLGISLTAAVTAGFRFRQHYFILLTPVVALAGGWGISHAVDLMMSIRKKAVRYLLLNSFIIGIVGLPAAAHWEYVCSYTPDQISRKLYGMNPFVESPHIAEYVRQNTPEDETIFVFGSEPQIYFYAGIKNPTNQLFIYPLTARYGKSGEFQREVVSAVKQARPYYIIWIDIQTSLYASAPALDRHVFTELDAMVRNEYLLDGYILIGRNLSEYRFGETSIDPLYGNERIPILLYKRKQ